MNTSLSNFNDVIIPKAIPLFPLAQGWVMLFILLAALGLYLGVNCYRKYQRELYIREAFEQIHVISKIAAPKEQYLALLDLLKRTALSAYGRDTVAALHGEEWWKFLSLHSKANFENKYVLLSAQILYSNTQISNDDVHHFSVLCKKWIKTHKKVAL